MPWFVVRLTKGDAIEAARRLARDGLLPYCPIEVTMRVHRRDPSKTMRAHEKPLFPGYLFVQREGSGGPNSKALKKTLGSKMKGFYMSFDGDYLLARDKDIEHCRGVELRVREDAMRVSGPRLWKAGDAVTILRGVLSGSLGTVLDVRRRSLFISLAGKGAFFVDVGMVK